MALNSFEEKIQKIMDGLGAVNGVTYALLVVDRASQTDSF